YLMLLIISAILFAILQMSFPYCIKRLINILITHDSHLANEIGHMTILLCLIWVAIPINIGLQGIISSRFFPSFKINIKNKILGQALDRRLEFFLDCVPTLINKKISELSSSAERVLQISIFNILIIVSLFVTSCIILSLVNPIFSIIVLIWCFLHILVFCKHINHGMRLEFIYLKCADESSKYINDVIKNILPIRVFNGLENEKNNLNNLHTSERLTHEKTLLFYEKMKLIQASLSIIVIIAIMLTLNYSYKAQHLDIPQYALVAMVSFSLFSSVWQATSQMIIFTRELGAISDSLSMLLNEIDTRHESSDGDFTIDRIDFEYVSYSYPSSNRLILNNLNLAIQKGEKIGIVGTNGAGKTTIIKILLQIFSPNHGVLKINNVDSKKLPIDHLYKEISIISQDSYLFDRSIMENIKYGAEYIDDYDIYKISKAIGLDSFINTLNNGYDTKVGSNGICLSGG
ncbi:MAG: ABC transporter ATP-binding protein, partial [Romboutsia sp.]|nr:ABC transporter ATP-binding protein [Romboutsia sp.]